MENFIEEIVILIFMSVLCFFEYLYESRRRKFYKNECERLSGEVISWGKHIEGAGRSARTCYDIDVLAENGEVYYCSVADMRARKYRKRKKDIVILVPIGMKTKDELSQMYDELDENLQKAYLTKEYFIQHNQSKYGVIPRESAPSTAKCILLLAASVLALLCMIIVIVSSIAD